MKIYGVLDENDCHIDVSKSLLATKRHAKKEGYNKISCRYEYNVIILFELVNNRWVELKSKNQ